MGSPHFVQTVCSRSRSWGVPQEKQVSPTKLWENRMRPTIASSPEPQPVCSSLSRCGEPARGALRPVRLDLDAGCPPPEARGRGGDRSRSREGVEDQLTRLRDLAEQGVEDAEGLVVRVRAP